MPVKSSAVRPPNRKKANHLGTTILKARVAKKLTQLALAHAIGFKGPEAGSYICRVEAGEFSPQLGTLYKLADALGVSLETLTRR